MAATTDTDMRLRGKTRWSMTARCPRMGAMGLLGEPPEEPDEETVRRWKRGTLDEQWFVEEILIPKYGRDNLLLQKAVEWGPPGQVIGELHPDVFVVSEGMPFEIKSHLDGEPAEYDYVQLCGEMRFDPDAGRAGALVVIGRDLDWEAIPVMLTDERIDQVEDLARQVADAGLTGELPDRVCSKPADGRSRMCPYVDACFAGWTPPDVIEIDGDLARIAAEACLLDQQRKPLRQAADEADAAYKAAVGQLAEFELQPGRVYEGAGVRVKRTHVGDVERLSVKKLRDAGVWTDEDDTRFGPFVSWSGAHDRWTIDATDEALNRARQAAAEASFGDGAPF